jgi:tetraacyldisaccharide 4'-kinase
LETVKELSPLPGQRLFFSTIRYGRLYHIIHQAPRELFRESEVLLVCGIANPKPLTSYLEEQTSSYEAMFFSDHHIFSVDDLADIRSRFSDMQGSDKLIVTTEKDAVRLVKYRQELRDLPFYVLPISVGFLFGEEQEFQALILNFIRNFGKQEQYGEKGE